MEAHGAQAFQHAKTATRVAGLYSARFETVERGKLPEKFENITKTSGRCSKSDAEKIYAFCIAQKGKATSKGMRTEESVDRILANQAIEKSGELLTGLRNGFRRFTVGAAEHQRRLFHPKLERAMGAGGHR